MGLLHAVIGAALELRPEVKIEELEQIDNCAAHDRDGSFAPERYATRDGILTLMQHQPLIL